MVEGSDFDKKMDDMFNKMLEQGMSEEQIMKKMMGTMKVEQGQNGEVEFDPEGMMIDDEMFKEFEKLMNIQKDDPQLKEMMKQMANQKLEVKEEELSEDDHEFLKKH